MIARSIVAVVIAVGALTCGSDEEPALPMSEGSPFALAVGTCFDDPPLVERRVVEVDVVDCDHVHDNEVHGLVTLPDGEFPGPLAIVQRADEACVERFERYVGVSYAESTYLVSYYGPTEESWELGDRTVTCFLHAEDGPSVGSAAGTGR